MSTGGRTGAFSDFSKLSKSIAADSAHEAPPRRTVAESAGSKVPSLLGEMMGVPPAAKAPPPPNRRADAAVQAENARSEAAAYEEALQEMAREKVEAEGLLEAAERRIGELESKVAALAAEKDSLEGKLAAEKAALEKRLAGEKSLREESLAAAEERFKLELEEARAHSASVSVLLDRPEEFPEVFAGEVREHVLDALKESFESAEGAGRERRARILEAVVAANPSTGELKRRREEVKRILREGGRAVDDFLVTELARLGFRHVGDGASGKFVYAGVRIALPAEPSGPASVDNLAY